MSIPPSRSTTPAGTLRGSVYDKTRYGIIPTPSSPTEMSPEMTQSMSNSPTNSSISPPESSEPTTPPVGRRRNQYPELGRVPLHRRGTSKTYERLEDLLREAGYKETRIFTPETERLDGRDYSEESGNSGEDNRSSVVKDGMDAVVGFFAGLLPSAAASKSSLHASTECSTSPREYSPLPSPLTQKHTLRQRSVDLTEPPTPTNMTSSLDSLGDPTPKASRQISRYQPQSSSMVTSSRNASLSRTVQKQPSRSTIHHHHHHLASGGAGNSNEGIISPRPSRAGAYLRHMASTQSMPGRPNSTPVHLFNNRPALRLNDEDSDLLGPRRGNGEGEGSDEPPLPPTWLETVARAVLFGGTGAYIGGPSHPNATSHDLPRSSTHVYSSGSLRQGKSQVLRSTRSSLSQVSSARRPKNSHHPQSLLKTAPTGLSDQTNKVASNVNGFLVPPPLLSKIERGRAGMSQGEVSMTRVVCRSAPGSRSNSIVRGAGGEEGKGWKPKQERGRRHAKKKSDQDRLPSLARTRTEGDVWSSSTTKSKPLNSWGGEAYSDGEFDEDMNTPSSDDDDDGELNLARILVPPKRQNSIKSLRKHLAVDSPISGATGAHGTLKHIAYASASRGINVVSAATPGVLKRKPTITEDEWDGENPEEWGAGWVRRDRTTRMINDDGDADSFTGILGESRGLGGRHGDSSKGRSMFSSPWKGS